MCRAGGGGVGVGVGMGEGDWEEKNRIENNRSKRTSKGVGAKIFRKC